MSIAVDIQRGRIIACQSDFDVAAIAESWFQLIFASFEPLRFIEFQTNKM
jgi:hypothetical protein